MEVIQLEQDSKTRRLAYEDLKKKSFVEQRFWFFDGELIPFTDMTRAETDTNVYWAATTHTPKWNNKSGIYLKHASNYGCSYDKTTKKFKWWFGKQVLNFAQSIVADMCKYFNAEWFINEPVNLRYSTTNSVFVKVLTGKITDRHALIQAIVKANPVLRRHNLDIDLLNDYVSSNRNNRIQILGEYIDVAEDTNVFLRSMVNQDGHSWMLGTVVKAARMLDRKIDFSVVHNEDVLREMKTKFNNDVDKLKGEFVGIIGF